MTTLPLDLSRQSPDAKAFEAGLRLRVVGQDDAIRRLAEVSVGTRRGRMMEPLANGRSHLADLCAGRERMLIHPCLLFEPQKILKARSRSYGIYD
jgi:hypothetical protein